MKQQTTKYSIIAILAMLLLLVIINNQGKSYVYVNISTGKGCIKANLLKYVLPESYFVADNQIIVNNCKKKTIRKWVIYRSNKNTFYFKVLDETIDAIGQYEFIRLNKINNRLEYIELNMSIYPDNTSELRIHSIRNRKVESIISGRTYVDVQNGFNQRGSIIFEQIINGTFDKNIIFKDTLPVQILSKLQIERMMKL